MLSLSKTRHPLSLTSCFSKVSAIAPVGKRQRTGAVQDASRRTEHSDLATAFGLRQSSGAFALLNTYFGRAGRGGRLLAGGTRLVVEIRLLTSAATFREAALPFSVHPY